MIGSGGGSAQGATQCTDMPRQTGAQVDLALSWWAQMVEPEVAVLPIATALEAVAPPTPPPVDDAPAEAVSFNPRPQQKRRRWCWCLCSRVYKWGGSAFWAVVLRGGCAETQLCAERRLC
jgi:hypothetical protein